MEIEKFKNHKVSISKDKLELCIDIWGDAEYTFTQQFGAELNQLWNIYQAKPMGTPTRSRAKTSFGIGENVMMPTTIIASFLCEEDMNDYENHVRKALKKDVYCSYKEVRAEREAQAEKEKEYRKIALNNLT